MLSETPEQRAQRKAKEAARAKAGASSSSSSRPSSRSKKDAAPALPPALQFGPIAQTVAIMLILCLLMGTIPLPREMRAFYTLFSRITGTAVLLVVGHASIVAYGYKLALAALPPEKEDEDKKEKNKWVYRPDDWAHTRSHPSHFLTTRSATPRIFPFPLGKTAPKATVKDELWWEGGNAPHVGHFNRPKLPQPPAPPSKSELKAKAKKLEEIAAQKRLWDKRMLHIKLLCGVVLISFLNAKIAAACLALLIYRALDSEIDGIMSPPRPIKAERPENIDLVQRKPVPNAGMLQPNMGMSYIYGEDGKGGLGQEAAIPITPGPAPVLLTSANPYYAN